MSVPKPRPKPPAPALCFLGPVEKLRGVEEGVRPEARQHETGAMDRGLARARDVEFERGGTRTRLHKGR